MLSVDEYQTLRDLIYSNTGMALQDNKIAFLARRVNSRMTELELRTVRDYCRYLSLDGTGNELEKLVNLIVIGETSFFRNYPQWQFFAETLLPLIVEKKGDDRTLSFLSAGCSTGEEPYTLAIILKEMLDRVDDWKLRISGVDINSASLQKGREGVYTRHALRETPYMYRDRYFTPIRADSYALSSEIKEMVTFSQMNLFDTSQMATLPAYDIVWCKNVLIYFDRHSAGKVMEHFYALMKAGAFIFLGAAESVGRLTNAFTMVRFGKSFVYRK